MLPSKIVYSLYHTLISSYLDYCNIVWASYNSTFLQIFFRTPKKAIRLINNSPWNTHSTYLFYKSAILKLHDINTFQVTSFMYIFISGILIVSFQFFFVLNKNIHNHSTRYSNNVHINSRATQVGAY